MFIYNGCVKVPELLFMNHQISIDIALTQLLVSFLNEVPVVLFKFLVAYRRQLAPPGP